MNNRRGFSSTLVLIVIAVIGLGAWYYSNSRSMGDSDTQVSKEETWTHEYRSHSEFVSQWPNEYHNGLVISTQAAAHVKADHVYLESPGFIVVHRIVRDSPDEVLGVSELLSQGLHKDVPLNASLEAGKVYFALLYADDGDGVFNLEKDTELLFYDGPNKVYLENRVAQFETL